MQTRDPAVGEMQNEGQVVLLQDGGNNGGLLLSPWRAN